MAMLELGLCVTSLGQLPWLPGFHGYQVRMVNAALVSDAMAWKKVKLLL